MFGTQLVDQLDSGRRRDHAGDFFFIGHHMPSLKKSEPRNAARPGRTANA
jgi:hypothetical protein